MAKAVALLSGGLDSMLAARLVIDQGVEVVGVHFDSIFNCGPKPGSEPSAVRAAKALGVDLVHLDFTRTQMALLKSPPHGFGSAANPCIDCHMAMLVRAAAYMDEIGADFILTGEVLGQRPMSQRAFALRLIDKETGLAGKILRPLSARLLPPTEPEQNGLVDRDRLEDISGRTRTRQMAMAARFGLTEYPSPAGGCLLTDPGFGLRVKDLLAHGELDEANAELLKVGRHFRLDAHAKVVVGRNADECKRIEELARSGDVLLEMADITGPTGLLRGAASSGNVLAAAALVARSSKAKTAPSAAVRTRYPGTDEPGPRVEVTPASDDFAAQYSINPLDEPRKETKR